MNVFLNIIWFIFCGLIQGLSWVLLGCLWCISIVGIPIGKQCFKFAKLSFFPFGKVIHYGESAGSLFLNILWMLITGIPMAVEAAVMGLALCVTLIGIPFGIQCFKMAGLALMPFGATIEKAP